MSGARSGKLDNGPLPHFETLSCSPITQDSKYTLLKGGLLGKGSLADVYVCC
jgi:hypothetical protein